MLVRIRPVADGPARPAPVRVMPHLLVRRSVKICTHLRTRTYDISHPVRDEPGDPYQPSAVIYRPRRRTGTCGISGLARDGPGHR
ncbi:MAG: hypothetical protein HYX78_00500 [Armatimonadetes bacterium]|nr:hypothetical protein [Armatimonadota bacterium]